MTDARKSNPIGTAATCLLLLAVAAGLLRLAPVMVYDCAAGPGGAHCRIERRWAGVLPIDAAQVEGIDHANGSGWGGRRSSKSQIELERPDGSVVYEDTQQGPIGIGHRELADRINAIAQGKDSAPLHAWRVPWLPLLFVSFIAIFVLPFALEALRRLLWPAGQPRARLFIGIVAALILACWIAAFLGEVPAFLAAAPK